jgi:hypothetical protein
MRLTRILILLANEMFLEVHCCELRVSGRLVFEPLAFEASAFVEQPLRLITKEGIRRLRLAARNDKRLQI